MERKFNEREDEQEPGNVPGSSNDHKKGLERIILPEFEKMQEEAQKEIADLTFYTRQAEATLRELQD